MIDSLNMVCQVNTTSYGVVATNVIKQLIRMGIRVSLFPVLQDCQRCRVGHMEVFQEDHDIFRECLENARMFDPDAPSVRLWHQFGLDMYPAPRSLKVAWPIFELDRFNAIELHHLRAQERIIVCSKWAKKVLENNNVNIPTYIVPLGVDTNIFYPNQVIVTKDSVGPTRFYCIGKQEYRKFHDGIRDCFDMAFRPSDKVELHMFWGNRLLSDQQKSEWNRYYENSRMKDKIFLYNWLPTQKELSTKLTNMDCGLFLSRAEGWDLGLLESMAMGKQVITTDYSGHTEFVNSKNSMLVSIDNLENAHDGLWFHGQGNWALINRKQEETIIQYMREIHIRKESGDNLFNSNGIETAKKFSWENTVNKLLEALQ